MFNNNNNNNSLDKKIIILFQSLLIKQIQILMEVLLDKFNLK